MTPSARSASLIAGDGTKNGFPAPYKEPTINQNHYLTGKAPYRFESCFLQQTVRLSWEVARLGREPRLFARVCGRGEVARSAETGIGRRPGANWRQCLCWAKFQYRSASDVVQVVAALAERGWSWLSRSSEAEHRPLLVPGERQTGARQQLGCAGHGRGCGRQRRG